MSEISYEKKDHIALVTINRPDVHNSMDPSAEKEMAAVWLDFREDDDLWVAILTGAGHKAFCTGGDLKAYLPARMAGEAKANMVKEALENEPSVLYPASVLNKLKNGRFYLTSGAAMSLQASVDAFYKEGEWTLAKTERAVIDLCMRLGKYSHHLSLEDLKEDRYCRMIPNLSENTVTEVFKSIEAKFERGTAVEKTQVYYHTGPHHDDIMLGINPHIHRLMREESNTNYFSVLTSGFTAVTNDFIIKALEDTSYFLDQGQTRM